jgi:hypothetical protein
MFVQKIQLNENEMVSVGTKARGLAEVLKRTKVGILRSNAKFIVYYGVFNPRKYFVQWWQRILRLHRSLKLN